MNYKLKLASAALAAVFFVGCDDAKKSVKNISEQPELQGKFLSSCEAFGVEGMASISVQDEIRFTGNQLKINSVLYSNSECSDDAELGEIVYEGEFEVERRGLERVVADYETLTEEQKKDLDAGLITLELKEAHVRASDQTLVSLLNGISFCGSSDFQVDKKKDLTESSDEFFCPLKKVPARLLGGYVYHEDKKELVLSQQPTSLDKDPTSSSDSDAEREEAREDAAEDSVVAQPGLQIIDIFSAKFYKD